jgi:hypothetical protein
MYVYTCARTLTRCSHYIRYPHTYTHTHTHSHTQLTTTHSRPPDEDLMRDPTDLIEFRVKRPAVDEKELTEEEKLAQDEDRTGACV